MQKELIYTLYERFWHWLQAVMILTLLFTGFSVHYSGSAGVISFATAVRLHNVVGWLLVINAFLGFFYYVTTGTVRQLIPEPRELHVLAWRQLRYYLYGMFHGEPHPLQRSRQRRLNPLQQLTYLAILNILLPIQVVTGVTLWFMQYSPELMHRVGGIGNLAAVHMLGAWFFAAFVLAHIYLATTGPTLWQHFVTMITGYEIVEEPSAGDATSAQQNEIA